MFVIQNTYWRKLAISLCLNYKNEGLLPLSTPMGKNCGGQLFKRISANSAYMRHLFSTERSANISWLNLIKIPHVDCLRGSLGTLHIKSL